MTPVGLGFIGSQFSTFAPKKIAYIRLLLRTSGDQKVLTSMTFEPNLKQTLLYSYFKIIHTQ